MDSYLAVMPVFALKASRTFWKFSCSAPPQRDVTVIVPPAAGLPPPPLPDAAGEDAPPVLPAGEAVPPPFEQAMRSADTTSSVAPRRDRFIKTSTEARRPRPLARTRLHEGFVRFPTAGRVAPPRAMVRAAVPVLHPATLRFGRYWAADRRVVACPAHPVWGTRRIVDGFAVRAGD